VLFSSVRFRTALTNLTLPCHQHNEDFVMADKGSKIPHEGTLALDNGWLMHYADVGEGPAVLMLHGSGPGAGGRNNFDANWPALVEAGFRVILPDQLGFGFSSKPQDIVYDIGVFAETTLALLQHLAIDNCAVIGNSLGGSIALHIAIEYPGIFSSMQLPAISTSAVPFSKARTRR